MELDDSLNEAMSKKKIEKEGRVKIINHYKMSNRTHKVSYSYSTIDDPYDNLELMKERLRN